MIMDIVKWGVFIHGAQGYWMFSNLNFFPSDNSFNGVLGNYTLNGEY